MFPDLFSSGITIWGIYTTPKLSNKILWGILRLKMNIAYLTVT